MSNYSTIQYVNNNEMNNDNLDDSISIESINTLTESVVENNISEISNLSALKTTQESEKNKSESEGNLFKELDDSYDFEPSIISQNNNKPEVEKQENSFKETETKNNSVLSKDISLEKPTEGSNDYSIFIILLLVLLFFYF